MFRNGYGFLLLLVVFTQCELKADVEIHPKIDGVSFAASKEQIESADLEPVSSIGADWITLMPYGFVRENENVIHYDVPWQWVGERTDGIKKDIETCQKTGLKIMLKPHVWVMHGAYTGDYVLPDEKKWKEFEQSYLNYILEFAKIAQEYEVELFCIGTEWRKFVRERPVFWTKLIEDVRKVYEGKLTYASNWDEYTETPFWGQLDYVGVNAYFPLTEKPGPTLEELKVAWNPIVEQLYQLSKETQKPILLTEYGYRSGVGTTITPWESYKQLPVSMEEQKIALKALFRYVWSQDYIAGGFLWKWFNKHMQRGGHEHTGFTPQNKPAENIVRKWYGTNP